MDFDGDVQATAMLHAVLQWSFDDMKIYYVQIGKEAKVHDDKRIEIIYTNINLGFGGNNNLGIRASLEDEHDWTLLINNDAKISSESIAALIENAGKVLRDDVFSFAPTLHEENSSGKKIYTGGRDISLHLNTRQERSAIKLDSDSVHEVFYNIGSILLLNNEHLKKIGLMDEDYFFSGEVADLCFRASQQDLSNICLLDVMSEHFPEDHRRRRTLYKYYSLRNRFVFIRKHNLPKSRMWKFYRFLLKDLFYQVLRMNGEQVRTNWICLVDSLKGVTGNQNHKFNA